LPPLPPICRPQDLPNAVNTSFMIEKLGLNSSNGNPLRHRNWYMQVSLCT
ncbi:unnamed protein product, partial [Sphacelaria rigidula]